jgi:hypothetical protein
MRDQVFLLQAPIATPTEPPVGISQLSGYLRSQGIEITIADLNLALFNGLMTRASIERCLAIAERRLARLDGGPQLEAKHLLSYVPLLQHASLASLPDRIDAAVGVFRDPERFYDFGSYLGAARATRSALGLLSATLSPFSVDFTDVSSLLHSFDNSDDLYRAIDDFQHIEDNVALDLLNAELDRVFGDRTPKIVGVSITYAHQFFFGMLLARLVRRRFPETFIALGGPLVATIANRGRKVGRYTLFRDADAITVSDGEIAFRTIVEHVLAGIPLPPTANVILFDREKGVGVIPEVNVVEDLDSLPCADFTGLPLDRYWTPTPVLPLPIARGCYWDKCTFCYYGFVPDGRRATAPYRERSVDKIVGDIAQLNRLHGCRHFDFTVDLVAPTLLDRLAGSLSAAGLDVKWMLESRAEKSFTRERCRTLKAGGMTYAAFGLESMDQEVLNSIDKGAKVAQYAAALGNFYDEGIATHSMGFFDFPTEDYDAALRSIDFLKEHDRHLSEVGWGTFILDLGSQVQRDPERFGIEPIVDETEDLATSIRHAQLTPKKTDEQRQSIEKLFEEYRLQYDKYSILGRPFLGGGSLEPHCLIFFGKLGPSASAEFTRFSKQALAAEVKETDRLRINIRELFLRYPVKEVYQLFSEFRSLLNDDKAGPVRLGQRLGKGERIRRFDEERRSPSPRDARRVLATPDQIVEIKEAQWQVLSTFAEPRRVGDVLELYPENQAQVQALLRRALSYGWLEPVAAAQ